MDISNKTLAMFLVAAIVVSLAGTMISLNKLEGMSYGNGFTGFATQEDGNVTLDVTSSLSINILGSNSIDFGACTVAGGEDATINSLDTENTSTYCTTFSQSNITVANDGNINANVTINISDVGEADGGTFLDSSVAGTSQIGYRTENHSANPGCDASASGGWQWFTSAAGNYTACDRLLFGSNNRFVYNARIILPQGTTAGDNFYLSFIAEPAN